MHDALLLKSTAFDVVDDLLLKLYFVYEKSAKKSRELEDIVSDQKECFSFDDNRVKPVRARGYRWVAHKLNAMNRVVSKFGAYTCHLAASAEDSSIKPVDCAKLKSYFNK